MPALYYLMFPLLLTSQVWASHDPRELSAVPSVGRLERENRCTVTLISNSCAITAGHCLFYDDYIELEPPEYVEFNVPQTIDYIVQSSGPEDRYTIDHGYYIANSSPIYGEFGVIKLRPNPITKKLPGEVQGIYPIALNKPARGTIVRLTGFGVSDTPHKHQSQKTITGIMTSNESSDFPKYTDVHTTRSDSGAAIIIEDTQEIIGVHTTGDTKPGSGYGTFIPGNQEFIDAINRCRETENK